MSCDTGEGSRGVVSYQVLQLLCELRGEPVMKTSEIAEILDISTEFARQQLEDLRERGVVGCRVVDGVTFWWPT